MVLVNVIIIDTGYVIWTDLGAAW